MTHTLIVGTTRSGKTTLAKRIAAQVYSSGRGVLILDPLRDPEWRGDFNTTNPEHYLEIVKKNKSCTLIIDEAGETCGQHDKPMHWLATQARHWGHNSIFISQRAALVARTIRDNCATLCCFRVSKEDAKLLAQDFVFSQLLDAHTLAQGEFYYAPRFGAITKQNIFKNGVDK